MTNVIERPAVAAAPAIIRQLSRREVLAVWAAAALPMGAAAWLVAPILANSPEDGLSLFKALVVALTAGLAWQTVLVVGLVGAEQRTLRWSRLRRALWLNAPRSPRSGRVGGRVWLVTLPLIVLFAAGEAIPSLPHPAERDFGLTLESEAGQAFFRGNWGWFGLIVIMFVLNTVLGEELLFRGYLLPRMQQSFGERAWLVNGLLFGAYHVHVPWAIPAVVLVDTFALSYATQRYRSAWIGIVVHSAQTVVLIIALLTIVA
ncbi:MAG: type II CAAX endopeptidase family protein [Actinomycetota bacterium]